MTPTPSPTWDPDHIPTGSGDPETDATPETLLYIAREAWRFSAPDLDELAARQTLTHTERKAILFWLSPLERLVRVILFLILPRDLRCRRPQECPTGGPEEGAVQVALDAAESAAHHRPKPKTPPTSTPPRPIFRYWTTRSKTPDIVFDFSQPETEAAFAQWLAERKARRRAARARPPNANYPAAPLGRRLEALLGVLNDPLAHADRLASRIRRHRPRFSFNPPPASLRSGPQPPGVHAIMRGLTALRADLDPLIGPPRPPSRPHWSSG